MKIMLKHIRRRVGTAAVISAAVSGVRYSSFSIGSARANMPAAQGKPMIIAVLMASFMFSFTSPKSLSLNPAEIAGTRLMAIA